MNPSYSPSVPNRLRSRKRRVFHPSCRAGNARSRGRASRGKGMYPIGSTSNDDPRTRAIIRPNHRDEHMPSRAWHGRSIHCRMDGRRPTIRNYANLPRWQASATTRHPMVGQRGTAGLNQGSHPEHCGHRPGKSRPCPVRTAQLGRRRRIRSNLRLVGQVGGHLAVS